MAVNPDGRIEMPQPVRDARDDPDPTTLVVLASRRADDLLLTLVKAKPR